MNAVQMMNRIDYYNDFTRSARYSYAQYGEAVNGVILTYIDEQLGFGVGEGKNSFEYVQKIRDRLYTLIKDTTPTITNGATIVGRYGTFIPSHVVYPGDYQNFVALYVTIDGYTSYVRPTDYGRIGPLLDNSFMKPTNKKVYYIEDASGITLYRGVGGTFSTVNFTYLKAPAVFSLGSENDWITAGGAITSGLTYIAVDDSVQDGNIYLSGTEFVASAPTALTSGKVILASNTTPCDLPEQTHDTICKMISSLMLGVTSNFNGSQFVEKEVSKNN